MFALVLTSLQSCVGISGLNHYLFLLPFLLMLRNNFQRIDAAKKGYTKVAVMAGERYDAGFQVKMEYGYLFGNLFGMVLFFFLINRLPLS
jgi:hypothetical protein